MSYFEQLGLAEPILRALASKGYDTPTPIQRDAIPALLKGRDLCGIAQTGTGKTAAFSLPSLHHLSTNAKHRPVKSCRMLVLSPTRELAAQIADNMKEYAKFLRLSVECVFGGIPINRQIRRIADGVDVMVATPGRLLDLIEQRAFHLGGVEIFVLDEADQMMDLGFIEPLKRIDKLLPRERQSLFFSATMPKAIADLGSRFLNNPVRVEVAPQSTTAERVNQFVTFVSQKEKQSLLTLRIKAIDSDKVLVFTRTKHGADRVVRHLVGAGLRAAAIHGNKSQAQRTMALQAFKDGKVNTLVATDIAARGIDITGVSHVFNFEMPNVAEQYVHRIGRTARNGADGISESFVAPDEKPYLKDIERLTQVKLSPLPLPEDFLKQAAALPAPTAHAADRGRPSGPHGGRGGHHGERSSGRGDGGHREGGRGFGGRGGGQRGRGGEGRGGEGREDRAVAARGPGDRPASQWNPVKRPTDDRVRSERPAGERPAADRPRGERPDQPHRDRPRGDRPRGDRPAGDRPYGDRPRNDRPERSSDRKAADRPIRRVDTPHGGGRPQGGGFKRAS